MKHLHRNDDDDDDDDDNCCIVVKTGDLRGVSPATTSDTRGGRPAG